MLGVENEKIEFREGEQLGNAGGRPGEEAAEEGFAVANAVAEERLSFQFSVFSFQFPNQRSRHFLDFDNLAQQTRIGRLRNEFQITSE